MNRRKQTKRAKPTYTSAQAHSLPEPRRCMEPLIPTREMLDATFQNAVRAYRRAEAVQAADHAHAAVLDAVKGYAYARSAHNAQALCDASEALHAASASAIKAYLTIALIDRARADEAAEEESEIRK